MKLSDYAKQAGIRYETAWRWFRDGKIKGHCARGFAGGFNVDYLLVLCAFIWSGAGAASDRKDNAGVE